MLSPQTLRQPETLPRSPVSDAGRNAQLYFGVGANFTLNHQPTLCLAKTPSGRKKSLAIVFGCERVFCDQVLNRIGAELNPDLPIDWKAVGRRIRELRGYDTKQAEMAHAVRGSQSYLSAIERARKSQELLCSIELPSGTANRSNGF